MARINMQLLIPVATAGWGILTWAADRERERNKERARISALYVNPFLSAPECRRARDTFWDIQVAKMTALGDSL